MLQYNIGQHQAGQEAKIVFMEKIKVFRQIHTIGGRPCPEPFITSLCPTLDFKEFAFSTGVSCKPVAAANSGGKSGSYSWSEIN